MIGEAVEIHRQQTLDGVLHPAQCDRVGRLLVLGFRASSREVDCGRR